MAVGLFTLAVVAEAPQPLRQEKLAAVSVLVVAAVGTITAVQGQ